MLVQSIQCDNCSATLEGPDALAAGWLIAAVTRSRDYTPKRQIAATPKLEAAEVMAEMLGDVGVDYVNAAYRDIAKMSGVFNPPKHASLHFCPECCKGDLSSVVSCLNAAPETAYGGSLVPFQ